MTKPTFIEITVDDDEEKDGVSTLINLADIVTIQDCSDGCMIEMRGQDNFTSSETYASVKDKIKYA